MLLVRHIQTAMCNPQNTVSGVSYSRGIEFGVSRGREVADTTGSDAGRRQPKKTRRG